MARAKLGLYSYTDTDVTFDLVLGNNELSARTPGGSSMKFSERNYFETGCGSAHKLVRLSKNAEKGLKSIQEYRSAVVKGHGR